MVCNLLSGYEKQDCIRNTFSKNKCQKIISWRNGDGFPYLDNLSEILSNTGINLKGDLPSALTSSTQLVSVVIAAFNMNGTGPKKKWCISTCGMLLSQILFIISLSMKSEEYSWFQALCVFVYMLSFGHGLGPIPWLICHEILPKECRMVGQSIITFINMIFSMCVSLLYGVMKENMSQLIIMIIFMFVTLFAIVFGLYFLPRKLKPSDENLTLI